MTRRHLLFFAVATGLLAVHVSNLWRAPIYPFTDLPNHLAEAYLFRVLPNADESLRAHYELNVIWCSPATLHAYFASRFADVEFGSAVFYTLYFLLLPLTVLRLVTWARGDAWLGLLSLLLLYNFSATWGFSGFTAGIALTMLALVILVRYFTSPSALSALALACVLILTYYAHVIVFAFTALIVLTAVATQKGLSLRDRVICAAALVPVGALAAIWWTQFNVLQPEQSVLSFLKEYYQDEYVRTLQARAASMLNDNKRLAARPYGSLLSLFFITPLLLGAAAAVGRNRLWGLFRSDNPSRHVACVFLLLASACYLVLPDRLPGWWALYQRVTVFVLLGLIWVTATLIPATLLRASRIVVVVLVLVHAGAWFQYFSAFKNATEPYRFLIAGDPGLTNQPAGAIIADYTFRGYPVFFHFQNYQLIWNHGLVRSRITYYRSRLVRRRDGDRVEYLEYAGPEQFKALLDDYGQVPFLISRGAIRDIVEDGRFALVKRQGDWALLKRVQP
jgi:hypothetical protein